MSECLLNIKFHPRPGCATGAGVCALCVGGDFPARFGGVLVVATHLDDDAVGARVVCVIDNCNRGQHTHLAVRVDTGNDLVRLVDQRVCGLVGHELISASVLDGEDDVVHVGLCDIGVDVQLRGHGNHGVLLVDFLP